MPVLVRFVFLTRVSHLWFPADPAGAHAGHPCCALGFGPAPPMSLGLDWFCKAKRSVLALKMGTGVWDLTRLHRYVIQTRFGNALQLSRVNNREMMPAGKRSVLGDVFSQQRGGQRRLGAL